MWLLIIPVLLIIFYIVVKPYTVKYDNIVCFTGAIGSGKSLNSTETAIRLLKKQRASVKWNNLFHPRHKLPLPMLYSNIPLRISRKEMALVLTEEHLLLQKRIIPRSVVFLDEVDQFANQNEWKNVNLARLSGDVGGNFDEFVRLFRHYTKGGYLVLNTQSTDNIVTTIRRRMGCFVNLMYNRSFGIPFIRPHLLYFNKARNIMVSEDVKTIVQTNAEADYRTIIGFYPWKPRYDTYCYSGRYETVPYKNELQWAKMKTNKLIICPNKPQLKYTTSEEDPE